MIGATPRPEPQRSEGGNYQRNECRIEISPIGAATALPIVRALLSAHLDVPSGRRAQLDGQIRLACATVVLVVDSYSNF